MYTLHLFLRLLGILNETKLLIPKLFFYSEENVSQIYDKIYSVVLL